MIYLWDDGPRSWQGYCSGVKVGIDFFAKIRVEAVHDQLYSDIGFLLPPSTAIVTWETADKVGLRPPINSGSCEFFDFSHDW